MCATCASCTELQVCDHNELHLHHDIRNTEASNNQLDYLMAGVYTTKRGVVGALRRCNQWRESGEHGMIGVSIVLPGLALVMSGSTVQWDQERSNPASCH